jgi:hypothetical protein
MQQGEPCLAEPQARSWTPTCHLARTKVSSQLRAAADTPVLSVASTAAAPGSTESLRITQMQTRMTLMQCTSGCEASCRYMPVLACPADQPPVKRHLPGDTMLRKAFNCIVQAWFGMYMTATLLGTTTKPLDMHTFLWTVISLLCAPPQ